jgi:hypothetical protein
VKTAPVLVVSGLIFALLAPAHGVPAQKPLDAFVGTWKGTSLCVGKSRPACKNETVVYRFVSVADHPTQLRQLADKVIEGKRVPMGALMYQFNPQTNSLECEFKIGDTHGVWSYSAEADSITGALIILPDRTKVRDVKVRRVKDTEVPAAPALREYEEE